MFWAHMSSFYFFQFLRISHKAFLILFLAIWFSWIKTFEDVFYIFLHKKFVALGIMIWANTNLHNTRGCFYLHKRQLFGFWEEDFFKYTNFSIIKNYLLLRGCGTLLEETWIPITPSVILCAKFSWTVEISPTVLEKKI